MDGGKESKIIMKKTTGWQTVYGRITIHVDVEHNGVHQYEFVITKMTGQIVIGIDRGTQNMNFYFPNASTYHYGLDENGVFYEKGIILFAIIFHQ